MDPVVPVMFILLLPCHNLAQIRVTENVCEGTSREIDCGEAYINISKAVYGRTRYVACGRYDYRSCALDVADELASCNGQMRCMITASNTIAGDPCSGVPKYLNITYTCEDGTIYLEREPDHTAELSSSNFPNNYDNFGDFLWHVVAPIDSQIRLHFTDFDIEENHDFVIIYDGPTGSYDKATERVQFSGRTVPLNLTSINTCIWIRFRSNWRYKHKGFRALADVVVTPDWVCDFYTDDCGLIINQESWFTTKSGNHYYIRAFSSSDAGIIESFTIPYEFTSSEGTLSFAYYQSGTGFLSVTVCRSQQYTFYGITHPYILYEYIPYSCNGTQDVEIKFTATRYYHDTVITVNEILLLETPVSSTAPSSALTAYSTSKPSTNAVTLGTTTTSILLSASEKDTNISPSSPVASVPATALPSRGVLNSAVIPAVSSVLVLLIIGLVVVALFVYLRRRSRVPKTNGHDQDDDDLNLYNNPVYISEEDGLSTPDILVGINCTGGGNRSPSQHESPDENNQYENFDGDSKAHGKGEPFIHDNSSSADKLGKANLKSYPFYSVQDPSKRILNNKSQSEEEGLTYENTNKPQSSQDSNKVTNGKTGTNNASQELKKSPSPIKKHSSINDLQTRASSGYKTGPSHGTAVLDDDDEYNALTFNKSLDITRALKKPSAGGLNVSDGYGVLNLPEDQTDFLLPISPEIHNDNEYNSLNEPPEEHHNGKQEGEGSTPDTKAGMTDQPDVESEYYNYQDPSNMDQGSSYLRKPGEPETFSSDPNNILDSGKRVGDYHGYHATDDGDVNDGYYVNLDSKVSGEDEYSTIDQDQIHKSNEAGVADFEPVYSDEVYSEFN